MSKLNIAFTERQMQSLVRMQDSLDTTKAGVIRKALSLLEVVVRENHAGNTICVTRDGEIVKEIVGL